MKKSVIIILIISMLAVLLSGCGRQSAQEQDDGKLSVVATIFPAYDFARAIGGENINITMLIPAGSEIHSYEPTPQDIIKIQNCDIFIYNGGESDEWVNSVLSSVDKDLTVIKMMDCVTAVTEEIKEGMEAEENSSGETEFDEHVWTSPVNAERIAETIEKVMCEKDPDNANTYEASLSDYKDELQKLDESFKEIVENGARKTLVFADRFPARYFTEEYGIDYFAAYPGCAAESEASAKTVAFLADKVKEEGIPYVMYIEFSNEKMADTICEDTGCGKLEFNSCHNVSKSDFENGVTYLELMQRNLETVKDALN